VDEEEEDSRLLRVALLVASSTTAAVIVILVAVGTSRTGCFVLSCLSRDRAVFQEAYGTPSKSLSLFCVHSTLLLHHDEHHLPNSTFVEIVGTVADR
jgi:hypothetical protein